MRRKALASLLAWTLYLPAYGTFALAHSLGAAIAGAAGCGLGQGSAWVLLNSAAQEQVPDGVLGRVMGLIALVHRGAHATGLVFVAPLFAVVGTQVVFGGAAIAIAAVGLAGAAAAVVLARRQAAFAAGA